jgi:uncharacterized protein (TIGR02246 family)
VSDIEDLVKKYVGTWAEPDPEIRRKTIAELWAEDGTYSSASTVYRGREGIEEAITRTYDHFVPNGFTFRVAKIDTNHEAVRYQWEVLAPGGGEPVMKGTQIVIIGADGLMVRDHQFVDMRLSDK